MNKIILTLLFLLNFTNLSWAKDRMPAYPTGSKEIFPFKLPNEQWAYIDPTGKIVFKLDPEVQYTPTTFSDGRAQVWKSGRLFLLDEKGKLITINSPVYGVDHFSEELAAFTPNPFSMSTATDTNQWGFIDREGNVVITPQYDHVGKFSDGLALIQKAGKFQFIDKAGTIVIPYVFSSQNFSEKMAATAKDQCTTQQDNCIGFIDKTGKFVIEPQFSWAESFSEGLAAITLNNKSGYINKEGKTVIEPQFVRGGDFHEGLANVRRDEGGKPIWGYIEASGKTAISFQFEEAYPFSEGLAAVKLNGKWGFLNKQGEMVIPVRYDLNSCHNSGYFWGGITCVIEKDTEGKTLFEGFIDKEGKPVLVKE